ncbi:MAG: translation initiation factor [Weeksellaceae bacterium]|nr:translation initiation factor [Weeksellaceae bacterium]
MNDFQDKLKQLFPDAQVPEKQETSPDDLWIPGHPVECHFEKRNGKPCTIIKKYDGSNSDGKKLTKELQQLLGVGGSFKNEEIILQGDYRDRIMTYLKSIGFEVKRVGG